MYEIKGIIQKNVVLNEEPIKYVKTDKLPETDMEELCLMPDKKRTTKRPAVLPDLLNVCYLDIK